VLIFTHSRLSRNKMDNIHLEEMVIVVFTFINIKIVLKSNLGITDQQCNTL